MILLLGFSLTGVGIILGLAIILDGLTATRPGFVPEHSSLWPAGIPLVLGLGFVGLDIYLNG